MKRDFLIAYGSQTGQAESIAKQLKEKCETIGLSPRLHELNENEKEFKLEDELLAVIVISSTGDGDPPENAARFMRRICRRTLEQNFLKNLSYALLGLGDSNYSTFQGVPRKLDDQLQHLGAEQIIDTGEADDQVGLELEVEPWIETLLAKLCELFDIPKEELGKLLSATEAKKPSKPLMNGVNGLPSQKASGEVRVVEVPQKMILTAEPYDYPGEKSLIKGSEALSNDSALRVPVTPVTFLKCTVDSDVFDTTTLPYQNGHKMVGMFSAERDVTVVGTAAVSALDAGKPKREIVVDLGEHADEFRYEPGDAFYFLQPNPEAEVNFLLSRMGLLSEADNECTLSVDPESKKMAATVPAYMPPVSTLRYLFTHCVDIRRAPGRPILRIFADCTDDEGERRRLLELCSAQGMNDFTAFVRQPGLSIADVLFAFPNVKPLPERLLEQLPRLIPRPYSVANSFELGRGRARFVYSQLTFDATEGRRYQRVGLATEWLNTLHVGQKVQLMLKEPARFRFPLLDSSWDDALQMPLMLIGPGTGVSTFLSFLNKLLHHKLSVGDLPQVQRLLFFGCRNFKKDYIYRDELESYLREGVLSELITAESQPEEPVEERGKYVQDELVKKSSQVLDFLALPNSRVFLCGDAKGMSKDVWQTFVSIHVETAGKTQMEANAVMMNLKKQDRYIEDVWS